MIDPSTTSSFGPEIGSIQSRLFQLASTPCLELITNYFGFVIRGGHDDVNMIRSWINRMELPSPDLTMFSYRILNDKSVLSSKNKLRLLHSRLGNLHEKIIRRK